MRQQSNPVYHGQITIQSVKKLIPHRIPYFEFGEPNGEERRSRGEE